MYTLHPLPPPRSYLFLFVFAVMARKLTNLQNYNMYLYSPEYIYLLNDVYSDISL